MVVVTPRTGTKPQIKRKMNESGLREGKRLTEKKMRGKKCRQRKKGKTEEKSSQEQSGTAAAG